MKERYDLKCNNFLLLFLLKNPQILHTEPRCVLSCCVRANVDFLLPVCHRSTSSLSPLQILLTTVCHFSVLPCFTNTTGHELLVFVWFAWILAALAFAIHSAEPAARGHLSPPLTRPKTLPTCKSTVFKRSNDNTNIMQWIAEGAWEGNSYITVIRTASLKSLFKDRCFCFCMHTSNSL